MLFLTFGLLNEVAAVANIENVNCRDTPKMN